MSDEEVVTSTLAVIQVNDAPDVVEDPSIVTEKGSTVCDDDDHVGKVDETTDKESVTDCDDKDVGKEEGSLFDQTASWIASHPALLLLNNKKGKTQEEDEESPYSKVEVMKISINGKTYGIRSDPMKGLNELSTVITEAVDKVSTNRDSFGELLFCCNVIHVLYHIPNFLLLTDNGCGVRCNHQGYRRVHPGHRR